MRRPSATNWPQVYRFLLKQTSINYWEMRRPFPANQPQSTEYYYNKSVEPIGKSGGPSHLIAPSVQTLLHETSISYWEMRRPSTTNWPRVYRALLYQTSITYWEMRRPSPLTQPKFTEPYYTKPVEPIEKWGVPYPLIDLKCTVSYYTKLV